MPRIYLLAATANAWVLIFILAYNYRQNAAAINATLNDVVANTKQASIGNAENLINPVAATLSLLAAVAADRADLRRSMHIKIRFILVCSRLIGAG